MGPISKPGSLSLLQWAASGYHPHPPSGAPIGPCNHLLSQEPSTSQDFLFLSGLITAYSHLPSYTTVCHSDSLWPLTPSSTCDNWKFCSAPYPVSAPRVYLPLTELWLYAKNPQISSLNNLHYTWSTYTHTHGALHYTHCIIHGVPICIHMEQNKIWQIWCFSLPPNGVSVIRSTFPSRVFWILPIFVK